MTISDRIKRLDNLLNYCETKVVYSLSTLTIRKAYWRKRLDIQMEDYSE